MRREAMGFGDTTLMAVVGAALGAERALLTILGGAFVGGTRLRDELELIQLNIASSVPLAKLVLSEMIACSLQ